MEPEKFYYCSYLMEFYRDKNTLFGKQEQSIYRSNALLLFARNEDEAVGIATRTAKAALLESEELLHLSVEANEVPPAMIRRAHMNLT